MPDLAVTLYKEVRGRLKIMSCHLAILLHEKDESAYNAHCKHCPGQIPGGCTTKCNYCSGFNGTYESAKAVASARKKSAFPYKKGVFSYYAITNSQLGQAFAIGAIYYKDGKRHEFIGRCPIMGHINPWFAGEVLIKMKEIPETHKDYRSLLEAFFAFWKKARRDVTNIKTLVYMGLPREARLWIDANNMGIIDNWDIPSVQIDLVSFPEVGCVDTFNKSREISAKAENFVGGKFNPVYNSEQALRAYSVI